MTAQCRVCGTAGGSSPWLNEIKPGEPGSDELTSGSPSRLPDGLLAFSRALRAPGARCDWFVGLSSLLVAWVGVLLFALAGAGVAIAQDAQTIVRKVQDRYDATRDFTADVAQEMTIASLGKTTTAHGTVAFKKPGQMRWDLTNGDPQVIVADGQTLWFYQPKEHQVIKTAFDAAFRATTPISFLTGVGRISEDFDARVDGTDAGGKVVYLLLVPRRDSSTVGTLRLTVESASGDIQGAEIRDPLGNTSRMRFEHIQRNRNLPDERFVFEIPPGTDVITAPMGN